MAQDSNPLRITAPFGMLSETVQTSRYYFHNNERGDEQFVILQWTFQGTGEMSLGPETHYVPADHAFMVIVPEDSAYWYPAEAREPWRFGWLNFYGDLALHLCRRMRDIFGPVMPLHPQGNAGKTLLRLIRQADRRTWGDTYSSSAECYSFLMEWTRELEQPVQRRQPIQTAIRICQSRFREPIGVKELAAETGLTREHFTRLFLKETGIPPAKFLRQLRVEAACQLIDQHVISLKEIAFRCGFPSAKAMSRALVEAPSSKRNPKKTRK